MIDTSHQRAPASHTVSHEAVLPEWSVDVTVLPPVEPSNTTELASGAMLPQARVVMRSPLQADADACRLLEGGLLQSPLTVGEYCLPVEDLFLLLPVGAMRPHAERSRPPAHLLIDLVQSVLFPALGLFPLPVKNFERSDGRWIIHPRTGERRWIKDREESIRIMKLWSDEPQETHRSTPASGGKAPARGNHPSSSSASGRDVPACGGGDGGTLFTRSVSFRSTSVVPSSIAPPPGISRRDEYELLSRARSHVSW